MLSRIRLNQLPYIYVVTLGLLLLIAIFSVTVVLQLFNISLHSEMAGVLTLLMRDLIAAYIGLWMWDKTAEGRYLLPNLPPFNPFEKLLLLVVLMLLALYYLKILQFGSIETGSLLLIEQRNLSAPLRAFTLVAFQQTLIVGFLLDFSRQRFTDRGGLWLTAILFSTVHLFLALWMPWAMVFLFVMGSLLSMLLWGWLRINKGSLYAPFLLHYGFYLLVLNG